MDSFEQEDVQRQIGQFLKSTRKIYLTEYLAQDKKNLKLKQIKLK